MHELYELKEKLMEELKEYGNKDEMSAGMLEVVDKLTHTIKNLCKIIEEMEEDGYSDEGRSYARGRNARRDSRGRYSNEGRYSRDDEFKGKLYSLMDQAPDEKTKLDIRRMIDRM